MQLLDVLVSEHGGGQFGGKAGVLLGASDKQVLGSDSHSVGFFGHLTESFDESAVSFSGSACSDASEYKIVKSFDRVAVFYCV